MENEEIKKLRENEKNKDSEVRVGVARNENTLPEVLTELAKDENKWVRFAVARNESTPSETLAELAKDKSPWVREAVAGNKNISLDIPKSFHLKLLLYDHLDNCFVFGLIVSAFLLNYFVASKLLPYGGVFAYMLLALIGLFIEKIILIYLLVPIGENIYKLFKNYYY